MSESDDAKYIERCFAEKDALLSRPMLSGFRVFATLVYLTPEGERRSIDGTNVEIGWCGAGICAERSALARLRLVPWKRLEAVYIVSDAEGMLTPGLLCREFLMEFGDADTRVVLAWKGGAASGAFTHRVMSLGSLYPHPRLYLHQTGAHVRKAAEDFAKSAEKPGSSDAAAQSLYESALKATADDNKDYYYALRLAAAVLMSNGETYVTAQTKLAEFGFTLDPITKMVAYLEDQQKKGVRPVLLVQCDQYGNLHSPYAPARAHLYEGGHYCDVLIHDAKSGRLLRLAVPSFTPELPKIEAGLSAVPKEETGSVRSAAGAAAGDAAADAAKAS